MVDLRLSSVGEDDIFAISKAPESVVADEREASSDVVVILGP